MVFVVFANATKSSMNINIDDFVANHENDSRHGYGDAFADNQNNNIHTSNDHQYNNYKLHHCNCDHKNHKLITTITRVLIASSCNTCIAHRRRQLQCCWRSEGQRSSLVYQLPGRPDHPTPG